MGFNKLIERLYLKVFVGIATSYSGADVVVELRKGSKVQERAAKSFGEDETGAIAAFLEPYLAESPFHYIAYLNTTAEQGVLPVATQKEGEAFADLSTSVTISQNDKWLLYSSKFALDELRNGYSKIGIDFIFSPFNIIERFFKEKLDAPAALYVLAEEDAVTMAVFGEGTLLYGKRLLLPREEINLSDSDESDTIRLSFELDVDGIEEGLELDDINAIDDLEGLDDLHEIEDLDTLDDLDSFAEELDDGRSAAADAVEAEPEVETPMEHFGKDYKRFQLMQSALQEYYSDPKFDSRFIESIYIADGCGVSDDLKLYLEEELFVKVYVRRIDIAAEVADLARVEARDAS